MCALIAKANEILSEAHETGVEINKTTEAVRAALKAGGANREKIPIFMAAKRLIRAADRSIVAANTAIADAQEVLRQLGYPDEPITDRPMDINESISRVEWDVLATTKADIQ